MDDFDLADDIAIQFLEPVGRNPPFRMTRAADCLDWELPHERLSHVETSHKAFTALLDVPSQRNLYYASVVGDGIEDRLSRPT